MFFLRFFFFNSFFFLSFFFFFFKSVKRIEMEKDQSRWMKKCFLLQGQKVRANPSQLTNLTFFIHWAKSQMKTFQVMPAFKARCTEDRKIVAKDVWLLIQRPWFKISTSHNTYFQYSYQRKKWKKKTPLVWIQRKNNCLYQLLFFFPLLSRRLFCFIWPVLSTDYWSKFLFAVVILKINLTREILKMNSQKWILKQFNVSHFKNRQLMHDL